MKGNKDKSKISIVNDAEIASPAVTIEGNTLSDSYIEFPNSNDKFIGTPFPFLTLQIKNVNKYTGFEICIRDKTNTLRYIKSTNKQSLVRLKDNSCSLPLKLDNNWNIIIIDLKSLIYRIFKTEYKYSVYIKLFANTKIRRVYFSDKIYQEHELLETYQIYGMREHLLIKDT